MRSDESSLGILRHTYFVIKLKHLYLKAQVVCVFLVEESGEKPHGHGHKEGYKDCNLKILTSKRDSNPQAHEY